MTQQLHTSISTQDKWKLTSTQICVRLFTEALFIISSKRKEPKWMQGVVSPYNGILFNNKKKWNLHATHDTDEPQKVYATWKKPDTKGHILYASVDIT